MKGRVNELKAGAVLSYLVIAAQFLVAVLYTPLMLRLLGQVEYGLYSLTSSVVSYLSLLSFGFSGAYMRFYARFRVNSDFDGVRRLNGLFLIVFTTMSLIAGCGGALLAANVEVVLGSEFSASELGTARVLFAILTVNLVITFPSSVFTSYIAAHERFILEKSVQLARTIVNPLIVLPVLLLGHQSVGMAAATTVVNVFFTVYTVMFSLRRLGMGFSFRDLDFGLLKEVSLFSAFIFINMVVDQINWNIGKFFVGRFHGAAPVALYGIATLLNTQYLQFSTAISSVFIPRVNTAVAAGLEDREISALFVRVGRLQFLVLALVISGFIFFGRPFIELWAGDNYRDAYYMALFLMVPVTVPLLQNLGIEIQKAKNLHQFRSWAYLAVAVGNVFLSIPLTQRFGGIGAAAATGVTLLVGNGILMNWYYQARVGLDIRDFWHQIVRLSFGLLPAILVGAFMVAQLDLTHIAQLLACVSIYALVYVGGMWWFGMNEYERQLFRGPINRVLGRR